MNTHLMANDRQELHEILRQLITLKELSVSELAKLIKLPQPTIQRIVSGLYKKPHISTLKPIAQFFDITINQLRGLEPISFLGNKQSPGSIPLLNATQVLTWANVREEISEHVFCDIKIGKQSFAMAMPDSSMDPLIPKGSTLLIDPEKVPRHRSFIVVKIADHPEAIVRQLITDARKNFIKSLSHDLEQFKMTLLNQSDAILGVVVQVRLNCEDY